MYSYAISQPVHLTDNPEVQPQPRNKAVSWQRIENHIGAIWYFIHAYNASLPV